MGKVWREWVAYFPHVPGQSEFNRRARWLWGAFDHMRRYLSAAVPEDDCQLDTTVLPSKHPSMLRGPARWCGPRARHAGFAWDVAHQEWLHGLLSGVRTDLGQRPAAQLGAGCGRGG